MIFVLILIVSDIAIFVLKRDVKLQPSNQPTVLILKVHVTELN